MVAVTGKARLARTVIPIGGESVLITLQRCVLHVPALCIVLHYLYARSLIMKLPMWTLPHAIARWNTHPFTHVHLQMSRVLLLTAQMYRLLCYSGKSDYSRACWNGTSIFSSFSYSGIAIEFRYLYIVSLCHRAYFNNTCCCDISKFSILHEIPWWEVLQGIVTGQYYITNVIICLQLYNLTLQRKGCYAICAYVEAG